MSLVDTSIFLLLAEIERRRFQLLLLSSLFGLGGCGSQALKPDSEPAPVEAKVIKPEVASSPAKLTKSDLLATLLAQGQRALGQDHLTLPENDNAFDRFSAILMMQPEHEPAQAGLEAIFFAYADRLREAIAIGKLKQAQRELDLLRRYFPEDSRIKGLAATLTEAYVNAASHLAPPTAAMEEGIETVDLDENAVSKKSEGVILQLQAVATRIQEHDLKILIFARSDAEGRWIYKVMKEYLGDYRIRGDIRLSKRTAVQLKPVIN